ncbi:hypothetical protein [Bauldia sp.]|uniref:hypothetical protein n=1 Tax=Bauldia sp. TaxID=2575872 RepID=UPI003BAC62CC
MTFANASTNQGEERPSLLLQYVLLIAVAVLLRTIFTAPVETGGDAVRKWNLVGRLLDGEAFSALLQNHQTARWAINLPALGFAELFGWNLTTYFAIGIVLFAVFLCLSAFYLRKSGYGFIYFAFFVIVLFADPMFFRSTGQLQPFIFVAVFMLAHAYFVERGVQSQSQVSYASAALFIFLAYGAKETAVFFVPASCAYVLIAMGFRRGVNTLLWIGLYGVLLVLIEYAVINILAGRWVPLGRLDLLDRHWGNMQRHADGFAFGELFNSWRQLPFYTAVLFVAASASTAYVACRSWMARTMNPLMLPIFFFLSFAFFQTFAIRSLDPLVTFSPPQAKYLADLVPWACFAIVAAAALLISDISDRQMARRVWQALIGSALAICVAALLFPNQYWGHPKARAWIWHGDDTMAFVRDLVDSGVPITDLGGHRGPRVSRTVLGGILGRDLKTIQAEGRKRFLLVPNEAGKTPDIVDGFCIDGTAMKYGLYVTKCRLRESEQSTRNDAE